MILGIETATPSSSVALGDASGVIAQAPVPGGAHHAENLVPALASLCRQAGAALCDLEAIAVDVGPGLFTGLRVGVATAKGLAFALGIPVVTVVSLDVLVLPHLEAAPVTLGAIDARRGEVFVGQYGRGTSPGPLLMSPEQLEAIVASFAEDPTCVGDGFRRYLPALLDSAETSANDRPLAAAVVQLGQEGLAAGKQQDPRLVVPVYLRPPDARIHWESRPEVAST